MEGYNVKVINSTKELTPREKIRVKDFSNATSIDDATMSEGKIVIPYGYHVTLSVHNEKSDNKDYTKCVVVDANGNKYVTGSESFITTLDEIVEEMLDAGESDFEIEIYRKDSKNYKGKQFLTCSIV